MKINYELVEYNIKDNFITIRPKHPLFRNSSDTYPCYNVTISELDQSQDISKQLAQRSLAIIENILKEEYPEGYDKLREFLINNIGKEISTPVTELSPASFTVTQSETPSASGKIEFIN